jgi:hypothetical protein
VQGTFVLGYAAFADRVSFGRRDCFSVPIAFAFPISRCELGRGAIAFAQ